MIRFTPDTWRDAILRPLAMAAPDGGVYVEIMAPDFRFVFVLGLALVWLISAKRSKRLPMPVLALLLLTAIAFVPWLGTTGNGRYFIPFLLAIGVVCVALAHHLPYAKSTRTMVVVGLIAVQGFVLFASDPWHWWGLVPWRAAPYFELKADANAITRPATYVTMSSISYSLVAPLFHKDSSWINVTSLQTLPETSMERKRAQALLSSASRLQLMVPSLAGVRTADGQPEEKFLASLDSLLVTHRLAIARPSDCRLLPSKGLARFASKSLGTTAPAASLQSGFWLCALEHGTARAGASAAQALPADKVFEKLERTCPRFFPPDEAVTQPIPSGALRHYTNSDFKIYVLNDGRVYYRYWRALNAELVGIAADVLAGRATLDCGNIKGRSGLPWERGI